MRAENRLLLSIESATRVMSVAVLEGETLRERLVGGGLGWRKAAEIGASIADGLAVRELAPATSLETVQERTGAPLTAGPGLDRR